MHALLPVAARGHMLKSAVVSSCSSVTTTGDPTAKSVCARQHNPRSFLKLVTTPSYAGPGTKTQQELWQATNPGSALSAPQAVAFNQQASALQKRLNQQAGGNIQLVIANAIWTKKLAVRKEYADEMKAQFGVRKLGWMLWSWHPGLECIGLCSELSQKAVTSTAGILDS